ncbi:Maf family protein [Saccharibacillus sp. CPCC 101409]|uniref:Maf family protein n=1 Tax=Saccharibacillus sp. CPCC 101409 TaxID=3058041 RepID=UPI0026739CF9|nr:Maf family protein [Saccharibacillus sp. CPCC 101409]MDO3410184.1 Maf family protein [Saccharibacillus sp. CPCC 101409]
MNEQKRLLLLASGSPRRRELLALLGLPFEVRVSDADESTPEEWTPERIVTELARRKAEAVAAAADASGAVVIGSDTIVVLDGTVLGKPEDGRQAAEMLRSLSGRTHDVYTGVACIGIPDGRIFSDFSRSRVTMREIRETEIEAYIASGEPMDKAGSYAVQGLGAVFIERIEGDYHAIMGLPLNLLHGMLEQFGIRALA